jgi:hypothetical protein
MGQTIVHRGLRVAQGFGAVHRLQEEVAEGEVFEALRQGGGLGVDEFQFVAGGEGQGGIGLGADADPVNTGGRGEGAVGLYGDGEVLGVQRFDQGRVELEEGLAAGEDGEAVALVGGPVGGDFGGQGLGGLEAAAALAIRAHEIRVAEGADGGGAVLLAAGPEIAAGEAAEHGGAASLGAFALEGEEDFFDGVHGGGGYSRAEGLAVKGGRRCPLAGSDLAGNRMKFLPVLLAAALFCAVAVGGAAGPARAAAVAPDYGLAANWVCRPGAEGICTRGLDALIVAEDGARTVGKFAAAAAPPIDCFYVYPTVSEERSTYSDLRLTPEIADAARGQAGRLTSRCRLFAPIYRQLTGAGLSAVLAAHGSPDWRGPYADVLAAWRWYLAHDNQGRGVVLIAHSQGSILLQQLLAAEIDGKGGQRLLVAAFLGGDLSLPVAKAGKSGGVFGHIPLCTDGAQIGCVYVWNSYLADDRSADRVFGDNPAAPLVAGCASPAAPGGGMGDLKAYFARPASAPAGDPPWVHWAGALSGQCSADAQGTVLRVTIQPGRFADAVGAALRAGADGDPAGWGLHGVDMDLMQGNVLDRVRDETDTWLRGHAAPAR